MSGATCRFPELLPPAARRHPWRAFFAGLAAMCLAWPLPARAADDSLEYQVKAAFLLNFTKFTEWPGSAFAQADSPMSICIFGDDPFGNALDQVVAGEVVNDRKVTVQRIKAVPSPKACQVVFFSGAAKDSVRILHGLGPGVLTVGEGESFVRGGGMIGFVIDNRHIRFGINQTAAEGAGLRLSSKLLSLAKVVER